jgi:hypothetical protein
LLHSFSTEILRKTRNLLGRESTPQPLGLIGEYRFVVMPIIAGEERRLLEGISLRERLQPKLVESNAFLIAMRCASPVETVTEKSAGKFLAITSPPS